MNRSMFAGIALAAGIAVALPTLGWSADKPAAAPAAPAAPQQHGMAGGMGGGMHPMTGEGMPPMMGGMRGHHRGEMGGPGWMHGMMRHRMRHMTPRQRCEERLARRAGMVAYTVAKLNLTAAQRPLWDKLQGILQAAADRRHELCASLKPPAERSNETILDRIDRREKFLSARLQGLKEARPALEELYQALTPEQKAIINHPFRN